MPIVFKLIRLASINILLCSIGGFVMAQNKTVIGPGALSGSDSDLAGYLETDPNKAQYSINPGPIPAEPSTGASTIGLIDSGINPDHPQLRGRVAQMRSFTDAGPEDRIGHGTSVAIALLSFTQSAQVISANVIDADFSLRPQAVQQALRWLVAEQRVTIINASLGFETDQAGAQALCAEIDALAAEGHDFLLIAAAGNLGPETPMIPAVCESPYVVSVASDEASSGLGDVTAARPITLDRAGYLRQLSTQLIEARRLSEALSLLTELRDLDPGDADVLASLAGIAFTLGQTHLARNAAFRWAELRPAAPEAHWVLALSSANLGQLDAALTALDRVIGLDADYKQAAGLRALLATRPDDLSTALRIFFRTEE
jgi:Flp pilus assembly protein TadD